MHSDGQLHGHLYLNSSPFHHDIYDCTMSMLPGPCSTLEATSSDSILTHHTDNGMPSLPSLPSITTSSTNMGTSPTITMPRTSSIPDSLTTTIYSTPRYVKLIN